ncbi:hypothetical protein MAHJHV55_51010 [Mycobacterium avium subsp. hominissuis]
MVVVRYERRGMERGRIRGPIQILPHKQARATPLTQFQAEAMSRPISGRTA